MRGLAVRHPQGTRPHSVAARASRHADTGPPPQGTACSEDTRSHRRTEWREVHHSAGSTIWTGTANQRAMQCRRACASGRAPRTRLRRVGAFILGISPGSALHFAQAEFEKGETMPESRSSTGSRIGSLPSSWLGWASAVFMLLGVALVFVQAAQPWGLTAALLLALVTGVLALAVKKDRSWINLGGRRSSYTRTRLRIGRRTRRRRALGSASVDSPPQRKASAISPRPRIHWRALVDGFVTHYLAVA